MQAGVCWSGIGRCALVSMAVSAMSLLSGCSSGVSRFDFPSFDLTRSQDAPLADPNTTASLPPVPSESVYASGSAAPNTYPNNYQNGSYSRSSLPPVAQPYTPQATRAAYSPAAPSLKPPKAAYVPLAPQSSLAKVRAAGHSAAEETYKVEQGDTPRIIAQKTGVSKKALIERNNLAPTRLKIGQVLYLPKDGKAPAERPPVAANESKPAPSARAQGPAPDVHVVKTTAIPAPRQVADKSQSGAKTQSTPAVASSSEVTGGQNPRVASVQQLPAPEPMSGNSFRWPVQGRIISEFGTKADGGHNDGIDVAVPLGTSVKAAENGVVAYAGDELKGYGNLVLIRHANNWVSAYAHNDEILVKRGDQVRRGQVIAKAGRTGQVSQPQLHFELRKGARPVDPTKFMGNDQASAD
jgi:murein DD-endopeptidase MepM/ murein hydrolase activator NlpD